MWVNTVLGVPYDRSGAVVELENISRHGEEYDSEIPEGVLVLTCGVDVQDDRVECDTVGWGINYESWGIDFRRIFTA